MKKISSILALVLALCLTLSMAACGDKGTTGDTTTEAQASAGVADIAGTYELDGSNWGMNLKWYITINADATFNIVTASGAAKGDGTVACKDGTFMLIYSDSTAESSKSATFTCADDKLTFSTSVPIGSASISSNDEHPENVYAVKTDVVPDAGTSYVTGTYTATDSSSNTVFSLTLKEDKTYTLVSDKGLSKTGSFEADGQNLTCADFAAQVSSRILAVELNLDTGKSMYVFYHNSIQGNFKASDSESTARYAATLEIKGAEFTLKTGTEDALTYLETNGTLSTKDNYLYLAFASGETTLVCVVSDTGISVADVPVAKDVKTSMKFEAYTPEVSDSIDSACIGSYTGSLDKAGMGSTVHYDFVFEIRDGGTYAYSSKFTMMGATYTYAEEGTVKVSGTAITVKAQKKVTSANMESGTLTDIAEAEQTETVGSIADGVITIDMKPSPMSSSAVSVTLKK